MIRAIRLAALLTLVIVATAGVLVLHTQRDNLADVEAGAAQLSPLDPHAVVVVADDPEHLDNVAAYAAARGYRVSARDESLSAIGVDLPGGTSVFDAIGEFAMLPGVAFAEPQFTMRAADTPSDPLYSRQSPYLAPVNAPQAWDIEQGRPEVIVAVLDTGLDVSHPDLQGRVWQNRGEIAGNGVDDDANGCVDDVHGCAFVHDPGAGCARATDGDINDDLGHGTFVAGIIAANGGNGGMVGVARNVTVMPVRVLDCDGGGTSLAVAQGILYAAKNGARVINISLGGTQNSLILSEAVRVVTDELGALLVAASGNSGEAGVTYPARYEKVLAVGAASIANADEPAEFTTTGPEVDVVAIGERVIGTVPQRACTAFLPCIGGQPYAAGSGTSFSAPQVAGLAALILSRRPGTAPAALHRLIKDTAVAVPAGGRREWAGAGRVDMAGALAPQYRLGVPGTTRN